jgi:hypothetical protein
MRNITRRGAVNALVGAAATPALAAPALAARSGDAKLRELWAQYLEDLAAEQAAYAAQEQARAAYDAEEPPCPDGVSHGVHFDAQRPLQEKHDLNRLYEAWNDAGERTDETVRAIREQEAEGLFGIGAKLAALPTQDMQDPAYDHEATIRSALRGIDQLIGTTFLVTFATVSGTSADDDLYEESEDEDDDGEDEAVS